MTLTIKEKEYWKDSIGRKIDRAIEELYSTSDNKFRQTVQKESRRRALRSLGILELQERIDKNANSIRELEDEQRENEKKVAAKFLEQFPQHRLSYLRTQILNDEIRRRQQRHERDLLAENPVGQRICRLLEEQEELLDTVWLATSPSQIKQLWTHLTEILERPTTTLQQEAIELPSDNIPPTQS